MSDDPLQRVIEINYTLHPDDGDIRYEERHQQHVPRVGELITFDPNHSYQIVDVFWHLPEESNIHVTVTAHELSWHKHIHEVTTEWQNTHANR
ncbi:MAG TPA: hypothetical protein VN327_00655 [Pseudonocardiaceae bacterium]|jgi:hypothetical protein|nr:hypothetical protein [Pseudonocardiaceae bacterium]